MGREYVPVFFDWLDVTQDLTAEEKGNLIDAVVSYASGCEYEHLLTGAVRIAFRFLKGQVDRNVAISEARSEARRNKTEQNETKQNKPEQTGSKSPKEKDNNKEKENNKDNKKRFTPPTVDEVAEYCRERDNNVDAQKFVDFYTSKGWCVGSNPMKDWRACVRTWERAREPTAVPVRTVTAQQYTQRDYGDEQDDAMRRMLNAAGL